MKRISMEFNGGSGPACACFFGADLVEVLDAQASDSLDFTDFLYFEQVKHDTYSGQHRALDRGR